MITVEVAKEWRGCIYEASGHGICPKKQDIVCAAVSTLLQALAVGLIDVLALNGVQCKKEEERIFIEWPPIMMKSQKHRQHYIL